MTAKGCNATKAVMAARTEMVATVWMKIAPDKIQVAALLSGVH